MELLTTNSCPPLVDEHKAYVRTKMETLTFQLGNILFNGEGLNHLLNLSHLPVLHIPGTGIYITKETSEVLRMWREPENFDKQVAIGSFSSELGPKTPYLSHASDYERWRIGRDIITSSLGSGVYQKYDARVKQFANEVISAMNSEAEFVMRDLTHELRKIMIPIVAKSIYNVDLPPYLVTTFIDSFLEFERYTYFDGLLRGLPNFFRPKASFKSIYKNEVPVHSCPMHRIWNPFILNNEQVNDAVRGIHDVMLFMLNHHQSLPGDLYALDYIDNLKRGLFSYSKSVPDLISELSTVFNANTGSTTHLLSLVLGKLGEPGNQHYQNAIISGDLTAEDFVTAVASVYHPFWFQLRDVTNPRGVEVDGFKVPQGGILVILNMYADRDYLRNIFGPNVPIFNPYKWAQAKGDYNHPLKLKRMNMFGRGSSHCPAGMLGLQIVSAVTEYLVNKYTISSKSLDPNLQYLGMLKPKKEYAVRFAPRT